MNEIIQSILDTVKENVASTPEYPEHVRAEAQRFMRKTDMSAAQAYVAAGDNAGLPDETIDREIVWSGYSVDEVRHSLREKKLDAEERAGESERTESAIEDWAESA